MYKRQEDYLNGFPNWLPVSGWLSYINEQGTYNTIQFDDLDNDSVIRVNARYGWLETPKAIVLANVEVAAILLGKGPRASGVETLYPDEPGRILETSVNKMLIDSVDQYKRSHNTSRRLA